MREDGSSGSDEKRIDLGHLLELWPMGHADGLDEGCEGKRGFKVSLGFGWTNQWRCIYLPGDDWTWNRIVYRCGLRVCLGKIKF